MDISQDSTLYVLRDVPLDITYNHTILFNSVTEQETYFKSKVKHTFEKYSYLRPQKSIKVGKNSDELYDCNYLYFKNNSYGQKNWFAFIKDIEYINDTTSLITFELDVMQTWHWNYTLKPSFVEREHVVDDTIGANTVPENLEQGDYVVSGQEITGLFNSWNYVTCVAVTMEIPWPPSGDWLPVAGSRYGDVYSGVKYYFFDSEGGMIGEEGPVLSLFLNIYNVAGHIDAIVAMFMFPDAFMPTLDGTRKYPAVKKSVTIQKENQSIDGYIPKNNKLFTSPYNIMTVINNAGDAIDYKYELFNSQECTFDIVGAVSCNPQFLLIPRDYRVDSDLSLAETMVLSGLPQCSFNNNLYLDWQARNAASIQVNKLHNTLGLAVGVARTILGDIGGGISQVTSSVSSISRTMAQQQDIKTLSVVPSSKPEAPAYFSARILDFHFIKQTIKKEFAKIIDNYFELYGYAVNTVKIPNRNARPHWTYLKTQNVNIVGSLPANTMDKIKEIYNNGITFWKNGNNVGNYSLNNH